MPVSGGGFEPYNAQAVGNETLLIVSNHVSQKPLPHQGFRSQSGVSPMSRVV